MTHDQKDPLVSAVIPAYNAERTIAGAVESALGQTHSLHEIIVIDDGSSDRTAAIAGTFPNIRVIHQRNRGVGAARNTGIEAASGEWIAFLDSDDAWVPRKTEVQMGCITEDAGVIHSNGFDAIHFGNLWHRQAFITPSGALVRKKTLEDVGGFEEARAIMSTEDRNLWLKISLTRWRFVRSETNLFRYQPTEESLSGNDLRMACAEMACIDMVGKQIKCQPKEIGRIGRAVQIEYARNLIAHERWADARVLLQKSESGMAGKWLSLVGLLRLNRLARSGLVKRLLCADEKYELRCCTGECELSETIRKECMRSCHTPYFAQVPGRKR